MQDTGRYRVWHDVSYASCDVIATVGYPSEPFEVVAP
jgi:hypothetical protein